MWDETWHIQIRRLYQWASFVKYEIILNDRIMLNSYLEELHEINASGNSVDEFEVDKMLSKCIIFSMV